MIEWGLERARQAALERAKEILKEGEIDEALTVVGQIAALRKIQKATQEILREFGVPDIPLSTEHEESTVKVSRLPLSPATAPAEIIVQEGTPALIEYSPTGKTLDIVQRPDLREELRKLGLSQRTHNLLVRARHISIEELVTMTDEELLEINNLGVVSLQELKTKLTERLSRIREERRSEREKKKKNNKDPHIHAEKIANLAEEYARELSRRSRYSAQEEKQPPTGAEIFERAIKQYLREFGFIEFSEEDKEHFSLLKAHMSYTQGVGRIVILQGLSTEERINLYLHFLAHIALEHENQSDFPDISARFEREDKRYLSKTAREEEKEADNWIRSFTEAIVARTEQKDGELEDWDEDREPSKKPKPQSKRSADAQRRWEEKRRVLFEIIDSSEQPMGVWDLLRTAKARGLEIYHNEIAIALKPLREAGQVRVEKKGRGYFYSRVPSEHPS